MNWFEKLTGFEEETPHQVRENLKVENGQLVSNVNNKSYTIGELEVSNLKSFQDRIDVTRYNSKIKLSEIITDVQSLHCDKNNQNALFQVASQFNLLEMIGYHIPPELGVGRYENDYTQGPACAIACGAGTIYRNYFVEVNGDIGQTVDNQIDCLEDLAVYFDNEELQLWRMQNGYALLNQEGLLHLNKTISQLSDIEYENAKSKLKVGVQWNTEVTIGENNHTVSQIYCSALPVAYSDIWNIYWEKFARFILEATYEATMYTGLLNYEKTGCKKVYLTMIGGGAFGNNEDWIVESMFKAIEKFKNTPLEVKLVTYDESNQLFHHKKIELEL